MIDLEAIKDTIRAANQVAFLDTEHSMLGLFLRRYKVDVPALVAEVERLTEQEIWPMGRVLAAEFPDAPEAQSACELAIRLLRCQKAEVERLQMELSCALAYIADQGLPYSELVNANL